MILARIKANKKVNFNPLNLNSKCSNKVLSRVIYQSNKTQHLDSSILLLNLSNNKIKIHINTL